jgi:hypothetical protein
VRKRFLRKLASESSNQDSAGEKAGLLSNHLIMRWLIHMPNMRGGPVLQKWRVKDNGVRLVRD